MASLVTGASGFLGGRLAQMLVEQDDDVTVLVRAESDVRHLPLDRLRVVWGDLAERAALREAVRGVQRVFHCAACSTDWAPEATYQAANVEGTANVLEAALGVPELERFVHVSTADIYGYPEVPCGEDHAFANVGLPYNRTKGVGEALVWDAARKHGLPVTVVRPATIYGPRGKDFTQEIATMLRQRMMATIDKGVTWATYLRAFCAQLGTPMPWMNLSAGAAMGLARALEVPHRLLHLGGRPLLTQHAVYLLSRNQEFPVDKARRDFGFVPRVSLEEGICRSVAWLRDESAPKR